jgi:hypothetical protein
MQNLSGTSSGKNNKSCRIFQHESKKISFAFLLFLYNFIWILQESAKWFYYLRCGFAAGSLELSDTSQICPWFTKNTLELKKGTQCHPWAWRVARLAGIGPLRWRPWSGKVGGRTRDSPVLGLWAWLVDRDCRRGCTTARSDGVRLELASGELSVGAERGRRGATSAERGGKG